MVLDKYRNVRWQLRKEASEKASSLHPLSPYLRLQLVHKKEKKVVKPHPNWEGVGEGHASLLFC